jgi:hypothetical protein
MEPVRPVCERVIASSSSLTAWPGSCYYQPHAFRRSGEMTRRTIGSKKLIGSLR